MDKTQDPASESAETTPDRIHKNTVLRASRARVWRALTQAEEFGTWFGAKLTGQFVPGAKVRGPISTEGYQHLTMEITIESVEPERLLSFRWHPYAIDPAVNYDSEPSTLVTFELEDVAEGTHLTVTESGFARIPADRRALAFRMNDGGWAAQVQNLARFVDGSQV